MSNLAIVCDSDDKILSGLQEIIDNTHTITAYAERASAAGKNNHDPEKIRELLFDAIGRAYEGDKEV